MTGNEEIPYKSFGRLLYEAFLVAVAILLLVGVATMLLSHMWPHRVSKRNIARRRIETLTNAMAQYVNDFYYPSSWADKETDYELNNARFVRALTSCNAKHGPYMDVPTSEMRDGMYVDPWARSYHFAIDANGDGKINLGRLAAHGTFAVWSEGPNQTDDQGEEDDVMKIW